jgi:RecJ-like exonuclease
MAVVDMQLKEMKNIRHFDSSASGFTGIMCETAMRFIGDGRRPTVGCNSSDGMVKASARCTRELLERGVDLSDAMNIAATHVGGGGGGHRIASGAWFPAGKEKEFLEKLDDVIGTQFNAK